MNHLLVFIVSLVTALSDIVGEGNGGPGGPGKPRAPKSINDYLMFTVEINSKSHVDIYMIQNYFKNSLLAKITF